MTRAKVLVLAGCLALAPGTAMAEDYFSPARRPKPGPVKCMDEREQKAEALIRSGLILRQYARECRRLGLDAQLLDLWDAFDAANGEQIKAAARLRDEAFKRNYPDNPNAAQESDSIILAARGLQTMAAEECQALRRVLERLLEYNDLVAHSTRTELGLVKASIPRCPTRSNRPP